MDDEPVTRVRLDLGYDGSAFLGWARQAVGRTVQGQLEDALGMLLRDAGPDPRLVVAGRTDSGVHARGQVAHVDLTAGQLAALARSSHADAGGARAGWTPARLQALVRTLNGIAGREGDLRVHRASLAPEGFDARFSALWRRYEYRLADAVAAQDPLVRGFTVFHPRELDVAAMDRAARSLAGLHDFAAYCRPRPGSTTIRDLQAFSWERDADGVLLARLQADAFCWSMVRALVGACVAVGERRLDPDAPRALRDAAERTQAFKVMPAHGLVLTEVGYPPDQDLAARSAQTRALRTPATPGRAFW